MGNIKETKELTHFTPHHPNNVQPQYTHSFQKTKTLSQGRQIIMTAFMPVCLNCAVYSWDQVKVPSPDGPFYIKEASSEPLQRCQKCKMAHYCDKDCQKEHWVKVHKERCKFSRGDKIQEAGVHRHLASLCLACKEEKVVGEVVKSKEDPHWGCHLQSSHEFWNNPTLTFRYECFY